MKALHIAASAMATILVMSLVFFAVQPDGKQKEATTTVTICQPDPEALKLAWSQGAETAALICNNTVKSLGANKPKSIITYWPSDSLEIMKILNGN